MRLDWQPGSRSPLQPDEAAVAQELLTELRGIERPEVRALAAAIVQQAECLDDFGALLHRYPSPLEEQFLGSRRRGLDTLVETLSTADRASFEFRAPTQAIVGRGLNMAQINFFRLLWHVCSELPAESQAARLRETAARMLRRSVYAKVVESVLSHLATDGELGGDVRSQAVSHLARLWGHRLTWRVDEIFPILEATWEARRRVDVVGGTLVGTTEMLQLLTRGADARFVDLLTEREHATDEMQAFREFLFGRSSEELDRLTEHMQREDLTSIELDSQLRGGGRDAGSVFFEFFQARFMQSAARRLAGLPGPRHTAEGYVMLAWLERSAPPG